MIKQPEPSQQEVEKAFQAFANEVEYKIELMRVAFALSDRPYEFRGANLAIQTDDSPEVMLSGPAGTGKSLANLFKINRLAWEYPGARILIVRKVRADVAFTALTTYEQHIMSEDNPIVSNVRREYRRVYHYPNGSTIVIGGLDRTTAVMSSEYDIIYVQEAVEVDESHWESLSTRLRNGVIPKPQLLGDTNPDAPDHWILQRRDRGDLKLYPTLHQENPALHDGESWTPEGERYVLGILERLTGVRKDRLLKGLWVLAEGAIYDNWSQKHHIRDDIKPGKGTRFISIDFGYTNPFVALWFEVDADGRLICYRELYMTKRLVRDHAKTINAWNEKDKSAGTPVQYMVGDHDAEGRATLERDTGLNFRPAKKGVQEGIQAVLDRLTVEGDGLPRLMFLAETLVEIDPELVDQARPWKTTQEFPTYVWNDRKTKEEPIKENDHGLDAVRYAVMEYDAATTKGTSRARGRGQMAGRADPFGSGSSSRRSRRRRRR